MFCGVLRSLVFHYVQSGGHTWHLWPYRYGRLKLNLYLLESVAQHMVGDKKESVAHVAALMLQWSLLRSTVTWNLTYYNSHKVEFNVTRQGAVFSIELCTQLQSSRYSLQFPPINFVWFGHLYNTAGRHCTGGDTFSLAPLAIPLPPPFKKYSVERRKTPTRKSTVRAVYLANHTCATLCEVVSDSRIFSW